MAQTVFPMIAYRDAAVAMEWLQSVFGFKERARMMNAEGQVIHGELELNGGVVMLATPSKDYEGPALHAEHCEAARQWLSVPWIVDGVLMYVEDVQAHFEHARTAGATILSQVEKGGAGLSYRAADLEGHRWMFAQR